MPVNAQEIATILEGIHDLAGLTPRQGWRPFCYRLVFNFADAAVVGTRIDDSISIESQTHFVCRAVRVLSRVDDSGRSDTAGGDDGAADLGGIHDPGVELLIQEGSGAQQWQDDFVDAAALYHPWSFLPIPRLIQANTTVTVAVRNYKVAAAGTGWDVRVHFWGYKVPAR